MLYRFSTGAVALVALILTFGPISGAHFNPVVSVADAWEGSLSWADTFTYVLAQILGGIAGSILAGPADVIAESRIWQRRHGGNLIHLYPYVLAAQKGLRERLGRMEAYHTKAKEIAALLTPFLLLRRGGRYRSPR